MNSGKILKANNMNLVEKYSIKIHCAKIQEAQILPPKYLSGLNRLREELPQFNSIDDVDSFSDFCKCSGTRVSKKFFKARELNPSQSHIDSDKVIDIVQDYTQSSPPIIQPLVVDKDGYIIDGHHRWSAIMYMNPNMEIPVYQFNVKIKRLLGNKVPRWQDTFGDSVMESFEGDLTDPEEIFKEISKSILVAFAKTAKLFAVKTGEGISVNDRAGKKYVYLKLVTKGAALLVNFPLSDTPETKVFNHWNPDYAPKILKALNTLSIELKDYWKDPAFAEENKAEIDKIRKQFRAEMSVF